MHSIWQDVKYGLRGLRKQPAFAVLAALTPAMLQQSASAAQAASTNMFNAQIAGITALIPGNTSVTVTISNPANNRWCVRSR